MYKLNEIITMNEIGLNLSHQDRVSGDQLSFFNQIWNDYPGISKIPKARQITHGEWEARQQKERKHESTSNE
jgi:hypothetical protein